MVKDLSLRDELVRKITHILAGVLGMAFALCIETTYGITTLTQVLFVGLLLALVSDYLRVEHGVKTNLVRFLLRNREVGRLHAVTYALLAVLVATIVFDRDITYASAATFFFGDAAAAICGRLWGRKKLYHKKSYVGTGAMFVVSAAVAIPITSSLPVGLTIAAVATIIELLSEKIDDSILIILFSGVAGQLLRGF